MRFLFDPIEEGGGGGGVSKPVQSSALPGLGGAGYNIPVQSSALPGLGGEGYDPNANTDFFDYSSDSLFQDATEARFNLDSNFFEETFFDDYAGGYGDYSAFPNRAKVTPGVDFDYGAKFNSPAELVDKYTSHPDAANVLTYNPVTDTVKLDVDAYNSLRGTLRRAITADFGIAKSAGYSITDTDTGAAPKTTGTKDAKWYNQQWLEYALGALTVGFSFYQYNQTRELEERMYKDSVARRDKELADEKDFAREMAQFNANAQINQIRQQQSAGGAGVTRSTGVDFR